jgi:hypothetical protein
MVMVQCAWRRFTFDVINYNTVNLEQIYRIKHFSDETLTTGWMIILVYTYFIGIANIYKQNKSNYTIGFRNKQMLFFKSISNEEHRNITKNIYTCWLKF